jgi:hypothetical protein
MVGRREKEVARGILRAKRKDGEARNTKWRGSTVQTKPSSVGKEPSAYGQAT